MLEDVFDLLARLLELVAGLFGLALGLVCASLGLHPFISQAFADSLLGSAPGSFGLVSDLLHDAHGVSFSTAIGGRTVLPSRLPLDRPW